VLQLDLLWLLRGDPAKPSGDQPKIRAGAFPPQPSNSGIAEKKGSFWKWTFSWDR
jgi:hypothetical protein